MSEKKIVIKIDDKGSINAETFGMVGAECVDELDKLMKDIALRGSRNKKPEFFEQEVQSSAKMKIKHD